MMYYQILLKKIFKTTWKPPWYFIHILIIFVIQQKCEVFIIWRSISNLIEYLFTLLQLKCGQIEYISDA